MTNSMAVALVLTIPLLFFASPPVAAATFLSIDCGAAEPYTDSRSIKWVGDEAYVRSGVPQLVEFSSSLVSVVNSLRAFPAGAKNCYSVAVDKGDRLLVRASFYYGNYDGLDSPPTFTLYYDNNYWTKVNLSLDATTYVNYEAIYTTKSNATTICLVQTVPGEVPFITALELRSLDKDMYNNLGPDYALFLMRRDALGATRNVRYPDDPYDRIWYPSFGIGLSEVTSEATSIDTSTAEDRPPAAVMQNATVGNSTISQYVRLLTDLPERETPVYLSIYFSEVSSAVALTQKRSFQLFINETQYSTTIVPPFGSVAELQVSNVTASAATRFTLRPTSDASFSPLVNAFEVYNVDSYLPLGTDPRDLEGLAILQVGFRVLLQWSGDPCLPSPYSWEWIECSKDKIPRVISLNLSSFGLFGPLPDFSSMDALVNIDLRNNSISGPIPKFLGLLPKLKKLDLSENRFNGSVPASLSDNKNLEFVVSDNCLAGMSCPPPPPEPESPPPPSPERLIPPSSSLGDGGTTPFFTGSGGIGSSGSNMKAEISLLFGGIAQILLFSLLLINF